MKITKQILSGYRGFRLRQINYFEYRPHKKTQVVLGSNGSGKTSLLRELSPLPAVSTDFAKGGYKEVHIEHNGHSYILKSDFGEEGTRFHFLMDGENLNPGYTVTVYRELVKQHFNYTQEDHLLLTGQIRFSSMSVNDRRKLFMRISETDFTYAVRYHQKIKEKVRDLQGSLKQSQARLAQEIAKCLSPEGEKAVRETVGELTHRLNTLLDHRKPRASDRNAIVGRVVESDDFLDEHLCRVGRLIDSLGESLHGLSKEGLESDSIALQANLQSFQREIVERCERIERQQKDLDAATLSSQTTIEDVQRSIKELEEEIDTLSRSIVYLLSFTDARAALSAFDTAKGYLSEIINSLCDLPQRSYSKEDYTQLTIARPSAEQTYLKAKAEEERLLNEKVILEKNREKGHIDCPKCHHVWYRDYDETQYRSLVQRHKLAVEAFEQAKARYEYLTKEISEYDHYYETMNRYVSLRNNFAILNPYWNMIDGKIISEPSSIPSTFQTLSVDLSYHVKIEATKQLLSEKVKLEKLILGTKQLDREKLQKEIDHENGLLLKAQASSREAQTKYNVIQTQLQSIRQIERFQESILRVLEERKKDYQLLIEDSCVAALDEMIRSLKLSLSEHERSLSQIDIQRAVVKNLEQQISSTEDELRLLKLAQKALSPSEGLIAKGMTGFINHFVRQINRFIEKIWLYPLELIPIANDNEESLDLDYRFSVKVNNDNVTPDVLKTSRGMQEIIDLAFVAVSMRYLGLANFPIFLDEFAITFDSAHRQSAYEAIEHLINSDDYSQVFIVSHYANGYNSLSESEVLVLCDSNVQLPTHLGYNQHVTMT